MSNFKSTFSGLEEPTQFDIGEIMISGRKLTFLLSIVLAVLMPARAMAVLPDGILYPAGNVVWMFNKSTGFLALCSSVQTTAGSPVGKCTGVGYLALDPNGYNISAVASSLFVVSRSSGSIQQCAAILTGTGPRGECLQINSLPI